MSRLGQFSRHLETPRLAARELARALPQPQLAEAHALEQVQRARELRFAGEVLERLVHDHVERFLRESVLMAACGRAFRINSAAQRNMPRTYLLSSPISCALLNAPGFVTLQDSVVNVGTTPTQTSRTALSCGT